MIKQFAPIIFISLSLLFTMCSSGGGEPAPTTPEETQKPGDNNEPPAEIASLFTPYGMGVEDSESGIIPQSALQSDELIIGDYFVQGGVLFLKLRSTNNYNYIRVGAKQVDGYYVLSNQNFVKSSDQDDYLYEFALLLGNNISAQTVDLEIAAYTNANEIVSKNSASLSVVQKAQTREEDVLISLSFENDKDLDLHLFTPSGDEIYFANPGTEDYGLILSSNDGRYPDGVRSEMIHISQNKLEVGEYRVCVNMYGNLNPNISTDYTVRMLSNNSNITLLSATNPALGTYEIGAASNLWDVSKYREVMRFRVGQSQSTSTFQNSGTRSSAKRIPLSEGAKRKLDEIRNAK